jgi:predicted Zn-dependent protease
MLSRQALIVAAVLAAGAALTAAGNPDPGVLYTSAAELWWDVVRDADGFGLQLSRVSTKEEIGAGARLANAYTLGLTLSPVWQVYVSSVGRHVAQAASRKDIPYQFSVIEDATVNAFSLAGGYIFVHRGLLDSMQSEAELASVLGHEIAHVDRRHSIERLQYELRMKRLGLGELGQLAGLLRSLEAQGFAQYQEIEADEEGLRLMFQAGYDPEAAFALMSRIFTPGVVRGAAQTPVEEIARVASATVFGYFRSHPPTGERLRRMRQAIEGYRKAAAGKTLYRGVENFGRRVPMSNRQFPGETVRQ